MGCGVTQTPFYRKYLEAFKVNHHLLLYEGKVRQNCLEEAPGEPHWRGGAVPGPQHGGGAAGPGEDEGGAPVPAGHQPRHHGLAQPQVRVHRQRRGPGQGGIEFFIFSFFTDNNLEKSS